MRILLLVLLLLVLFAGVPAHAQTATPTGTEPPITMFGYDLQYDGCGSFCRRSIGTSYTDLSPTDGLWQTSDGNGNAFGEIYIPENSYVKRVRMTGFASFIMALPCRNVAVHLYSEPGYGASATCVPIGQYIELEANINLTLSGWTGIYFYGLRAKSVTLVIYDAPTATPLARPTLSGLLTATPRGAGCFIGYCDLIATPTRISTPSGTLIPLSISHAQQIEMAQNAINMYRTFDKDRLLEKLFAFAIGASMLGMFLRFLLKQMGEKVDMSGFNEGIPISRRDRRR